jgi:hypothetical protein
MRLTATVPAVRGRTFESMRSTFDLMSEAIGERTGSAPDDPEVEAFSWAVLGVMQAAMNRLIEDKVTYEELPALLDHYLEFLARGCPL